MRIRDTLEFAETDTLLRDDRFAYTDFLRR